jgi:hypothetical protein
MRVFTSLFVALTVASVAACAPDAETGAKEETSSLESTGNDTFCAGLLVYVRDEAFPAAAREVFSDASIYEPTGAINVGTALALVPSAGAVTRPGLLVYGLPDFSVEMSSDHQSIVSKITSSGLKVLATGASPAAKAYDATRAIFEAMTKAQSTMIGTEELRRSSNGAIECRHSPSANYDSYSCTFRVDVRPMTDPSPAFVSSRPCL